MTHSARVADAVTRAVRQVLPEIAAEQITPERSLVELGATSIDRIDVTLAAMEALGLVVPPAALAGIGTIGGLIAILEDWSRRG